jgi:hypothetical protein|tara:strand:- start:818 stop:1303 length:486 start_codon:yes stop_codon:yes gene_type:complete
MLFCLPNELQKFISEYDEEFFPKKFIILKKKIRVELMDTNVYLSKVEKFNKVFDAMNDNVMNELKKENTIGSSFESWVGHIKRELSVPHDIAEYTRSKRQKYRHYKEMLNTCELALSRCCNHKTLRKESDDDYHRPRYEYFCVLCHTQVYRYNFKNDTKFI